MKTILFLTSTRADFGKLKPLIRAVANVSSLRYEIFATGMHMLSRYGSTVEEIRKSGFVNIQTHINQDGSAPAQMDLVLANTVQGLGLYVRERRPDLLVVHGDRVETLAGAIVGALNNIRVAHVEGGELSGTVDELMRHSVSKLSHAHFVANEEAHARLVQMGEAERSIFIIGSPDIDVMLSPALPSIEEVLARYEIPFTSYVIVVYHPVVTERETSAERARAFFDAIERSSRSFVVISPNNDAGSDAIFRELERVKNWPNVRLIPSMRFEYFLTLLRSAEAILGNSSAGVREAPVYGVPAINVGSRQRNRYCGPGVYDVPEESEALARALWELPDRHPPSRYFGDGRSAERFLSVLSAAEVWSLPLQKEFYDGAATSRR